jgi:hypothetical protein
LAIRTISSAETSISPRQEDRADLLRRDLIHVGVTRKALHIEGDPRRRSILFHDLRDTGLTHMAVRGDPPIRIQWAGGHSDFKTTQGYIDRGRVEARRIGEPLPPLPPEVLSGIAPQSPRGDSKAPNRPKTSRIVASPTGFEPTCSDFENKMRNVDLVVITAKS